MVDGWGGEVILARTVRRSIWLGACCLALTGLGQGAAASAPAAGSTEQLARQPANDQVHPAFLDPRVIRVAKGQVEQPDDALVAWGRERLAALEVADLPPAARAERITRYIHQTYAFTPDRPPTLADFVAARAGNCYAHARLSAFLLRLAGVPARFMYEVHLEHKTAAASEQARARGMGLFGQFHNDHFWVLYQDGESWVPLDSSLGIANREDFRRVKIDAPAGGVANPPFLLWRESADPESAMENVTAEFWRDIGRTTVPGVPEADWRALLDNLGRLEVADLRQPLTAEREAAIAHVGRQFFGVTTPP